MFTGAERPETSSYSGSFARVEGSFRSRSPFERNPLIPAPQPQSPHKLAGFFKRPVSSIPTRYCARA
jgi:hypothetical protein